MISRSVMSDSLQLHGLQPTRLLCPWDSQARTLEWPFPSPGDLPNPGTEPEPPALQAAVLSVIREAPLSYIVTMFNFLKNC